jgi:hypothetical protein
VFDIHTAVALVKMVEDTAESVPYTYMRTAILSIADNVVRKLVEREVRVHM